MMVLISAKVALGLSSHTYTNRRQLDGHATEASSREEKPSEEVRKGVPSDDALCTRAGMQTWAS
jgi:hypothetical protein